MVVSVLKQIFQAILVALLTEEFVKSLIIYGLEKLASKTDNKIDDELVARVKAALEKPKQQ